VAILTRLPWRFSRSRRWVCRPMVTAPFRAPLVDFRSTLRSGPLWESPERLAARRPACRLLTSPSGGPPPRAAHGGGTAASPGASREGRQGTSPPPAPTPGDKSIHFWDDEGFCSTASSEAAWLFSPARASSRDGAGLLASLLQRAAELGSRTPLYIRFPRAGSRTP